MQRKQPGGDVGMAGDPRTCPACGAPMAARKPWLARCPGCGYLGSTLTPGAGTGIEGLDAVRQMNFETLLDRLERTRPLAGLRLLEVGCAKGWFLDAARRRALRIHAIEPEAANAREAQAKGHAVETGFFPEHLVDRGPYDLIVFNDVFEHLPDPGGALAAVERLLAPGARAVLNLPSSNGALYRIATLMDRLGYAAPLDRLWQKGLPSPHVSYFNARSLERLARRHTRLVPTDTFPLVTVRRAGLRARVKSVNRGVMGEALLAGAWLFSFMAPWLPADIMVMVLEPQGAASECGDGGHSRDDDHN